MGCISPSLFCRGNMKIKIKETMATEYQAYHEGSIYEVNDFYARQWIAAGLAEAFSDPVETMDAKTSTIKADTLQKTGRKKVGAI
jgi:hypothetical protein